MDFYLTSDSSPAIHSKTTAKVRKRIGFTKFWVFFLPYLIYFSYLCHQINNNNIKGGYYASNKEQYKGRNHQKV